MVKKVGPRLRRNSMYTLFSASTLSTMSMLRMPAVSFSSRKNSTLPRWRMEAVMDQMESMAEGVKSSVRREDTTLLYSEA